MTTSEETLDSDGNFNKLGICEVCNTNQSKYTCPRCEVRTCGLACVKVHKLELECNGMRDKTVYKPLKKFGNLDLLSDYKLLEEVSKSVTKYRKDVNKRYTRYDNPLPLQLLKLKRAAYERGVKLMFFPQNFSKHRNNTTYFDWKTRNLYWRIEWLFFGISGPKTFTDERVLDVEKLGSIVAKYLSPTEPNPELELYYSANFAGTTLLMKAEKTTEKYYELDAHVSLRENFQGKKIIEFPTILVVLSHRKDEYELVDSEESS